MRYIGQSYELEVALNGGGDPFPLDTIGDAFERRHSQVYGHVRPGAAPEILNLRTVHSCPPPKLEVVRADGTGRSADEAQEGERQAYFGPHGLLTAPVYERARLPVGAEFDGPVVVEQVDTTTVVHPGWRLRVDDAGQLILVRS
jgi:N-methylhydantoinase A